MTKAFCPGNASCIFRIVENKDRTKRHSLGVGFTVDKGVIVNVGKSDKTEVFANGRKIRFPTVLTVIKELTQEPVKVEIKDQLPSGAGFGISGASALATAYALNKLLNLRKSKKELAMVAHRAEVINGTGLGDVGGQFNGGFNMKIKKGKPLAVVNLGIKCVDIYYKFFSKIETKKVINSRWKKRRINKAGDRALKRIMTLKNKTLDNIIRISKDFAVESGLLKDKRVKNLIEEIENKGGNASMIMLGNAVFSDMPFKGCRKVRVSHNKADLIK
ncbi:GHMP kinase [Candidatus Woesearchaeota archaeon]|nr:GHMP kinase [Candidatus Woesearchaeota archaeon]